MQPSLIFVMGISIWEDGIFILKEIEVLYSLSGEMSDHKISRILREIGW